MGRSGLSHGHGTGPGPSARRPASSASSCCSSGRKHLGSDRLPEYIAAMSAGPGPPSGVVIHTGEEVQGRGSWPQGRVAGVVTSRRTYQAPAVILGPRGRVGRGMDGGRSPAATALSYSQRGIEVGVRVEGPWRHSPGSDRHHLRSHLFRAHPQVRRPDPHLLHQPGRLRGPGKTIRIFVCVNGHAYLDAKSEKRQLRLPVQGGADRSGLRQPGLRRGHRPAGQHDRRRQIPFSSAFGDLMRGRRSTWSRIRRGSVAPTLASVTCGDIAMALPERIVANLVGRTGTAQRRLCPAWPTTRTPALRPGDQILRHPDRHRPRSGDGG